MRETSSDGQTPAPSQPSERSEFGRQPEDVWPATQLPEPTKSASLRSRDGQNMDVSVS